ncbi:MAG TPA: aminotransferase class V-fold PLP-dependent enzyme [Nitrolancea sp.]|nr:aminotransferase class V-fold PLP-dependent enzyme [Nitrolancea sp.]
MALDLALMRSEFPVTDEWAYLNHAAIGPFSRRTTAAVDAVVHGFSSPEVMNREARANAPDLARENVAALVGGNSERVAFVASLADAISLATAGLDWQPGDNVLIPREEFPSNVYPLLNLARRGVEVRYVEKDERGFTSIDKIAAAIDTRTRALVISHVEFMTGYRNDLHAIGALCRERDILSIVDGTQSIGPLPLSVDTDGIDVIAAHCYKWLMGAFGLGIMHFSERAIERIHPTYAGRLSVNSGFENLDYALDWRPGAQRYQTGGLNWIALTAFNASAELIRSVGSHEIEQHTLRLTDRLLDEVSAMGYQVTSDRDPAHRSQICSFSSGDAAQDAALVERMTSNGVAVSLRGKGIRVSPYFYNNDADIDRLLELLPRQ